MSGLGIPRHFREGPEDVSACGIEAPTYFAYDGRNVDCIRCQRTKAWKRYMGQETAKKATGHTVAVVEWVRGNRMLSGFIANAGLGLSGCGVKEQVAITYKPGEVVTVARVMKAVEHMILQADKTKAEFVISNPRVVAIRHQEQEP